MLASSQDLNQWLGQLDTERSAARKVCKRHQQNPATGTGTISQRVCFHHPLSCLNLFVTEADFPARIKPTTSTPYQHVQSYLCKETH